MCLFARSSLEWAKKKIENKQVMNKTKDIHSMCSHGLQSEPSHTSEIHHKSIHSSCISTIGRPNSACALFIYLMQIEKKERILTTTKCWSTSSSSSLTASLSLQAASKCERNVKLRKMYRAHTSKWRMHMGKWIWLLGRLGMIHERTLFYQQNICNKIIMNRFL